MSAERLPGPSRVAPGWILGALVIVALGVRAPRMVESLWYDELAAWRDYGGLGPTTILTTYHDPANHVLHTLLSWASVQAFESGLGPELALRLPALAFSLASIAMVWALARRAAGPRIALLAAAIIAFAPAAVLSGAEARGYSMMIFFAAAATWAILPGRDDTSGRPGLSPRSPGPPRGRRNPAQTRDRAVGAESSKPRSAARTIGAMCLYGLLAALGIWAHPMTVFVCAGHAAWMLVRLARGGRREAAAVGGALVAAALLTLFLYAPIIGQVGGAARRFGGASGGPPLFGAEGLHAILQLGGSWAWWAALPGLALLGLGAARAARDPVLGRAACLALLGLPVMAAAVVIAGTWTYARFTLFALPGAALLVAAGVDALWSRRRAAGAVALAVLAAGWATDLVTRPPKQPLRDAVEFVAAHGTRDELVLVVGLRHEVMDLYAQMMGVSIAQSPQHGRTLPADLDRVRPEWVIVLYPRSVGADRFAELDARGFRLAHRFAGWVDWGNGDVLVYRRND